MTKKTPDRLQELLDILKKGGADETKGGQLAEEIVFLEERMRELKKLPFIKINPKDPTKQKGTAAAKQYKELLQQYNNSLKLLLKIAGDLGEVEEESPLRIWAKKQEKK
jgi:hypothetical protein